MVIMRLLALGYVALVGWVTLGSVPWHTASNEAAVGVLTPGAWVDPATWSSGSAAEFLANVVMFIPIGVLLRASFPRLPLPVVVIAAFSLTLAIEVAQIPLDRVSDPRDLVANSLGGLVGAVAASVLRRRTLEVARVA